MNQRVTGWMLWGAVLFLTIASSQLHAAGVPRMMHYGDEERAQPAEEHHHHHKHEHKHEHHHHKS